MILFLLSPLSGITFAVVYTDPIGVVVHEVPAGLSIVSAPLLNEIIHSGYVQNVNGSTVDLSFTPSQVADRATYLHVLDGDAIGFVDTIISTEGSAAELEFGIVGLQPGDRISIRPHHTIDQLFEGQNPGNNSSITLYNRDGSTTGLTYFTGFGWYDSDFELAGDSAIFPGEGFVLNTSEPMRIVFNGSVSTHPLVVPVEGGKLALVGSLNPAVAKTVGDLFGGQLPNNSTVTIYQNQNLQLIPISGLTYFTGFGFYNAFFEESDHELLFPLEAATVLLAAPSAIMLPAAYSSVATDQ